MPQFRMKKVIRFSALVGFSILAVFMLAIFGYKQPGANAYPAQVPPAPSPTRTSGDCGGWKPLWGCWKY